MRFIYSDVMQRHTEIDRLEVQSFEMGVYLVKVQIGQNIGMLYEGERLKRFNNTQQIRDAFESIKVKIAVMKHDSPYDEMIGNPPKAENPMVLPFSMIQPY